MTPTEVELAHRASADLLKHLDADAAPSLLTSKPARKIAERVEVSIAQRLAQRSDQVAREALDPSFELSRIYEDPQDWFSRFGGVVLVGAAVDARQRARFRAGLELWVEDSDVEVALAMGSTAKSAISDAAQVLFASDSSVVAVAQQLGMYGTAMAVGRRYQTELAELSAQLRSSRFDQFAELALHTSRMAACRELRQTAMELQNV